MDELRAPPRILLPLPDIRRCSSVRGTGHVAPEQRSCASTSGYALRVEPPVEGGTDTPPGVVTFTVTSTPLWLRRWGVPFVQAIAAPVFLAVFAFAAWLLAVWYSDRYLSPSTTAWLVSTDAAVLLDWFHPAYHVRWRPHVYHRYHHMWRTVCRGNALACDAIPLAVLAAAVCGVYAAWRGVAGIKPRAQEQMLVLPDLGIQLTDTAGKVTFIPLWLVMDLVILECFKGLGVIYTLCVLVEDPQSSTPRMEVVFPHLLPRLATLTEVRRMGRQCLKQSRGRNVH